MQNIIIEEPYEFVPPVYSRFWPALIRLYIPAVHPQDLRRPLGRNPRRRAAQGVGRRRPRRHPRAQPLAGCPTRSRSPTSSRTSAATCTRWPRGTCSSRAGSNASCSAAIGAFSVYREGRRPAGDQHGGRHPGRRQAAAGAVRRGRHLAAQRPAHADDGRRVVHRPHRGQAARENPRRRRRRHSPRGHPLLLPRRSRWRRSRRCSRKSKAHFSWFPQTDKPLIQRLRQIAQALLSLKEIEYFGWARTGDFYERVDNLIEDVLDEARKAVEHPPARARASSPA